ncbi:hypothetical protein [Methylomonas sp. HYX-M1]|uniref:hypothetical protein n=1 Tax=Methylomonas sp. HYX-M1 TaxID=3139307 RepID=UPI00345C3CB6
MADIIKIKRSATTASPSSLSAGELSYSEQSGKLFYGRISDGTPVDIGGKWVVDKISALASADITDFNTAADARVAAANIDALANVHVPAPSNGQVLTYSTANSRWESAAAGNGVTEFVSLNDTPANYTGAGGAFVRVNAGATGLEFVTAIDGGTF